MQQNYTDKGYALIRAPEKVYAPLLKFFQDHQDRAEVETWPHGNTYTNHWAQNPTYMLSLEAREYPEGRRIKNQVWDAAREVLQEWTGETLKPSSLYGIRVYKEGAMLAPHVDRLPLVTSAIINVAQDLDSPWPVEIYDHQGNAENVTMMPGDMVLYESHTVVHGRPFPLDGRYFANCFVHFEPVDEQGKSKNEGSSESLSYPPPRHDANRLKTAQRLKGTPQPGEGLKYYQHHDHNSEEEAAAGGGDPVEVARHAAEQLVYESVLARKRVDAVKEGKAFVGSEAREARAEARAEASQAGEEAALEAREKAVASRGAWGAEAEEEEAAAFATGSTGLHEAAARGDLESVRKFLKEGSDVLGSDANSWHPIHEAARGGHLEVVKELVDAGADLGATTLQGGTPLWWARETLGDDNAVVQFLQELGAPDSEELVEEL